MIEVTNGVCQCVRKLSVTDYLNTYFRFCLKVLKNKTNLTSKLSRVTRKKYAGNGDILDNLLKHSTYRQDSKGDTSIIETLLKN